MKRYVIPSLLLLLIFLCKVNALDEWWHVYLTVPGSKNKQLQLNSPEKGIIRLIENSQTSFHGAFFDISYMPIVQALINAKKRGVDVKIVTESDNYDRRGITALIRAGIPVIIDKKAGFMHNKFAIIDGVIVWTGSYNLTDNDTNRNNNNAIEIHSKELADVFLDEFNEMYIYNIFGNKESGGFFGFVSNNIFSINGSDINVFFSPDDDIEKKITSLISRAKHTIHFMAFSFTSDAIGSAMVDAYNKGVKITGVIEKTGSSTKYSEFIKMKTAGIAVYRDKNPFLMHHKVIIIDGRIVIVGSFNFTKNANELNDENIIIIENEEIAQHYIDECTKLCINK